MTQQANIKITRCAGILLAVYILAVFAMSAWRHLGTDVRALTGPPRYGAYAEVPR